MLRFMVDQALAGGGWVEIEASLVFLVLEPQNPCFFGFSG